jgi:hypothetical protein
MELNFLQILGVNESKVSGKTADAKEVWGDFPINVFIST